MKIAKREPVLLAAALVAVLNLILGQDSGLTQDVAETLVLAVAGLVTRSKVSPTDG